MNHNKKTFLYLASAVIPFLLLLAALKAAGALPFGNDSILISDAWGQYMDFLSLWKSILVGDGNLFYTFSKNMGGDMLNLAAYYLLSPFNLLFLFSDLHNLPLFYTIVVLLKISACGLSFFFAAGRIFGIKPSGLLFSTAYAMCAYNLLYGWNLMWLDGVIILPLLMLGLHKLMDGKAPWLYCFCLFYGLATNFYIGYMLCVTSVIFFAAQLFVRRCSLTQISGHFLRFGVASVIGGLGAGVLWLPTFLSLAGERTQTNTTQFVLTQNFSIYGFLPKLLSGAASTSEMAGGTPHVFCGTFVLMLAAILLLNRKVDLRLRLAFAGVLMTIFISFWLQPLNIVWHGFSTNNSFNYRYAFVFSFFLICGAQYTYEQEIPHSKAVILLPGIAFLGAFLLAILQRRGFSHTLGSITSLLTLVTATFCLYFFPKTRRSLALLFAVTILELGINGIISWQELVTYNEIVQVDEYHKFVDSSEAAVEYIKKSDPGFYRMEKNYHRSINDPALLGYNGLSHFSSTEPVFTKQFMRKLGFSSEYDFWAWYGEGSTAEVDSLLGVKYLLSKFPLDGQKNYTLLEEQQGIYIYKNKSALPIANLVPDDICTVSMEENNPVLLHNNIWNGLSGSDNSILSPESYTISAHNLTLAEESSWGSVYERNAPDQDAFLRFEITVSKELPLYLYFSAPDYQQADLHINGENTGVYFHMNRWNMINTGTHVPGETLVAELHVPEDSLTITEGYFFYEDPLVVEALASAVQENAPELTRLSSSRFQGSFSAEEDHLLLFTIPYSKGWTLQIDDEQVLPLTALDTFLAASVPSGTHQFTLRYMPYGLIAGAGLSITALFMAGIWFYILKKRTAS